MHIERPGSGDGDESPETSVGVPTCRLLVVSSLGHLGPQGARGHCEGTCKAKHVPGGRLVGRGMSLTGAVALNVVTVRK